MMVDTEAPCLSGFDAGAFIRRLGEERVRKDAALTELVSQSTQEAGGGEEDVSWRSRRSIATNSLRCGPCWLKCLGMSFRPDWARAPVHACLRLSLALGAPMCQEVAWS
jgi:hypothetical protein